MFGNGLQLLRSWLDGPNRVRWIFGHRGKIPESLAVIKPGLLYRSIRVRKIKSRIPIGLGEKGVPLGAEFLEGLTIYEFLEFCFELFLWGFFIAFGIFKLIVCSPNSNYIFGYWIKKFDRFCVEFL